MEGVSALRRSGSLTVTIATPSASVVEIDLDECHVTFPSGVRTTADECRKNCSTSCSYR